MDPTDAVDVASAALGRRVDLAPTGSGGDHRSWWVGDDHVLRCAPDGSAGERLRREVRLRERLLARTSLPVPRSVASGSRHGQAWALDERLRGDPVDETGDTGAGVLRDLAALLVALDEVQSAGSGDLGLPGVESPDLAGVLAGAVRACCALDLPRAITVLTRPDARALVRASASPSRRAVLLHGDLKGAHLLVHDGRLNGVVDWADAGTGPVRLDVEGLAVAVGAERALTVAASAGVESVEAELGVLLARCRTTLRLAALRRGEPSGPGPLLARQWRLAWAGTSAQDDDVR